MAFEAISLISRPDPDVCLTPMFADVCPRCLPQKGRWLIGGKGHFMFNDSNDRASYWIGIAPGYLVGDLKKIWGSLAIVIGGIKKAEYHQGRFSIFALPYLSLGFNRIGLNVGYIPRIVGVTEPILLLQLKILVYPFRRL